MPWRPSVILETLHRQDIAGWCRRRWRTRLRDTHAEAVLAYRHRRDIGLLDRRQRYLACGKIGEDRVVLVGAKALEPMSQKIRMVGMGISCEVERIIGPSLTASSPY